MAKAAADRVRSPKGEKDLRDIAKILVLMDDPRPSLFDRHVTDDLKGTVDLVDHQVMLGVAGGNAHLARKLMDEARTHREKLWNSPSSPNPSAYRDT